MRFKRTLELDRATVDAETGEFPVTLFTDGEASDGHILDMAGGRLAPQMPLYANHFADPTYTLGSLTEPKREAHRIRYTAQIDLGAPEGAMADVRRDVLYMIARGHVRSMSGRWDADPKDVTPRAALPATHPAFVDAAKEAGRKRYGLFFRKWTALEGSVVGLGADPKALIGRALEAETPAAARDFWRELAAEPAETPLESLFGELRMLYQRALGEGAGFADVLNGLQGALGTEDAGELERVEREGAAVWLPRALAAALQGERAAYVEAREALTTAHVEVVKLTEGTLADLAELLRDDATEREGAPRARAEAPEATRSTVAAMPAAEFFDRFRDVMKEAVGAAVRQATGRLST